MRMYENPYEAFRETERDLWELGINVQVQTMQDKAVANDPDYLTKEVRWYGFQIVDWVWNDVQMADAIEYVVKDRGSNEMWEYIHAEFLDRTSGAQLNPGNAYKVRQDVWNEFLHDGKFAYTYSERIAPQLQRVIDELAVRPDTRQAIINIHSNICPGDANEVFRSTDLYSMGGASRVPCSLYYQFLRRDGKLDMAYAMRSCDFLTHFPVDVALALKIQKYVADILRVPTGTFTYFAGSLHAYAKDLKTRGIF